MIEKTVLFLNLRFSDFYSKDLFEKCKQAHHRFVAILDQHFKDKIPAHIKPYLDEIYVIESLSKEGFLAEFDFQQLQHIVENEKSKCTDLRIVCTDEFNLLIAARLREYFNLQGHRENQIEMYRDKLIMKKIIHDNGLRTPHFIPYHSHYSYHDLVKLISPTFILKPIDSCGSHGVSIIRNLEDYQKFQNSYAGGHFEAEEFIDGKLFHVDSYIRDYEIQFICANEYSCPNLEFTQGKALASIPLDANDSLTKRLIQFATQCLKALNANNMINHMELFVNANQEIIFLEVSARPPGALLNLTHHLNFGINLMDEDFFMQSGLSVNLNKPISDEKVFAALFPLQPGMIKTLIKPKVKSRCDLTWFVEQGQVIHESQCQNIVNKSAHAIFYNSNLEILRQDFARIKNHQALEVIADA